MLATTPIPCRVPEGVFDAFGWCESTTLELRAPGPLDLTTPIDGSDPARMVFVFHDDAAWRKTELPRELAALHALGLGLDAETWALAPYAIDDATDTFFERSVPPRDVLWLAADNVNALYWGLHDWAHFHNHGPFERRAFTELQCDLAAVAWLAANADGLGIEPEVLAAIRGQVVTLARGRFAAEDSSLLGPYEVALDMLWSPSPP